jgi:imidazole glycerol-phosphate synthase subunit HisH
MIGVVDYGAGNLRSVERALAHIGASFFTTARPEELARADRVVFPGVGEARAAMDVLAAGGLDEAIVAFVRSGRPLLGICIGAQVVLDSSEERDTRCLGLVAGRTVRFRIAPELKVPHMGWNQVRHTASHPVFEGIPDGACFYFVHSYYPELADRTLVVGETEYGLAFTAAFARDNIVATQFHPEKSGRHGLRLLANFCGVSAAPAL